MSHSDTRILARAIRERWPIPDHARPAAVQALLAVLDDSSALHRDRVMAVKALATLEAQNMAASGEGNVLGQAARLAEAIVQLGRQGPAQLPAPAPAPAPPAAGGPPR